MYKMTSKMRITPLIRTLQAVCRKVSAIERFYFLYVSEIKINFSILTHYWRFITLADGFASRFDNISFPA